MRGSEAIARILKEEGVGFLGIIPMNTLEEAAAITGIRPIVFRQERVGVNAADGFTRVMNGKSIGVFSMQAGPGAENAFAGAAQAFADSVPILLLPAAARLDRVGVHPTFSPSRAYDEVTKWSQQINLTERIPEIMRRAFSRLRQGRPGPVLLEMPGDVLRGDFPDEALTYGPVTPRRSAGDPRDIEQAVKMLLAAKRPIIQAGQGVLYAEAWDELRELAELTQTPVMTTMAGKSVFPENHSLALGTRSGTTTGHVAHFLERADVILGIGTSFTRNHYGANLMDNMVLIQCTNDVEDLGKDYDVDHAVIGDAKLVLEQLIEQTKDSLGAGQSVDGSETQAEIATAKAAWLDDWMPKLTSDEIPINPYRVVWDLMHTVDQENTIMTHDAGSPRDQIIPFYEALTPRGFLGWGKSTQLGHSLGLAMGAKLAAPDKTVAHLIGDYALGMVGMDIETAVRENIPILTVVLNNSSMAIYSHRSFPVATELFGAKSTGGDYASVGKALGAYAERVEKPQDVVPALQRGIQANKDGQSAVIEVISSEEQTFSMRGAV